MIKGDSFQSARFYKSGNILLWFLFSIILLGIFSQIAYTFYLYKLNNDLKEKNKHISLTLTQITKQSNEMSLELETKTNKISLLEKSLTHTEHEMDIFKIEVEHLQQSIQKALDESNILIKKKQALESQIDKISKEKNWAMEEMNKIKQNSFLANTIKENGEFKIQISHLEDKLKQEKLKNTKGISVLRNKLNSKLLDMEKMKLNHNHNIENFLSLKTASKQDRQTLSHLQQKVSDSQKLATSLSEEMRSKAQTIKKQEQQIQFIQKHYNIVNNKLSKSYEVEESLKKKIQAHTQTNEKKDKKILALKKEIVRIQSQFSHRLRELARAKDSLEKIMDNTRDNFMDIEDKKTTRSSSQAFTENSKNSPSASTEKDKKNTALPPSQESPHVLPTHQTFLDIQRKKHITKKAKIIELDYPQRLIVINRGTQDGLKQDMEVKIIQNKKEIGTGTILEAREQISAANIKILKNETVQINDEIVF